MERQEDRGGVPADWHPDPSGRHQHRYWDGASWTDHVADNGRQSTDPLLAPQAHSVRGSQVRKLLKEFATSPSQGAISGLNTLVSNSDDPDVTSALIEAFDIKTTNMGVFGLALQSLGLVKDPRALEFLMEKLGTLEALSKSTPNPQARTILADHYNRTACSIVNIVYNKRDSSPKAIPYLMKIYLSTDLPDAIKPNALVAIEYFADSHSEASDFYQRETKRMA